MGLLMTIVTKVVSRVDVVHPNDFLTLAIDCQDHRIKVCLVDLMSPVSLTTVTDSHTNSGTILRCCVCSAYKAT